MIKRIEYYIDDFLIGESIIKEDTFEERKNIADKLNIKNYNRFIIYTNNKLVLDSKYINLFYSDF